MRIRKIRTIQREVQRKLEELKRVQNKLEIRILAEFIIINYKRSLLNKLKKNVIDLIFSEGYYNRLRFRLGLNNFLKTG